MASHRHRIASSEDFIKPYKLKFFRRNRNRNVLIGCSICHPKKPITIKKTTRIQDLEGE